MPTFTKGHALGADRDGFDPDRSIQVLQLKKKTVVYLADDPDADVRVRNDTGEARSIVAIEEVGASKLSAKEKKAGVRKFVLTATDFGTTHVLAGPLTKPLTVFVVKNADGRLFDGGNDAVPNPALLPLRAFGLRGAALRIAEDQLHSSIGHTSGKGAGMYVRGTNEDGSLYDWCGAFCQWCYQQAARILGVANPFGDTPWALASPQRAISWAMAHPSLATVIRYSGQSPMAADNNLYGVKGQRKETQEFVDIQVAAHGNPSNITEGDICLVRKPDGSWKHVCMISNVAGSDTFDTINGNPKVWIQEGMKYGDKVGKVYKYAFLHLSLPAVDWIGGWSAENQATRPL